MRLRAKILLLLLPLVCLPLFAMGWLAYDQLEKTAQEKALDQARTLLQQTEQYVESRIRELKATVKLFSTASLIRKYVFTPDEEERYYLLQPALLHLFGGYLEAYPDVYEIRILMPDGYEDARATRGFVPNVSEDEAGEEYFRHLADMQDGVYATFFRNPDTEDVSLLAGMPLRLRDPSVDPILAEPILRGYIVVTMDLSFLRDQVNRAQLGKNGFIFVIDRSGELLFRPERSGLSEPLPETLVSELYREASDSFVTTDVAAARHILFSARPLHQDLLVVGAVPRSDLESASGRLRTLVGTVVSITILVVSFLLYTIVKILVLRPVRRLQEATQEIARGNLAVPVLVETKDELGELAAAFAHMSRSLRESNEQIQYLAYHDSLTGLSNRLMFRDFLIKAIPKAKRSGHTLALLYLDLDNFKRVNDTLGHHVGDELLVQFSKRLVSSLRSSDLVARTLWKIDGDLVARLGGDEFIVLLPEIRKPNDASIVARRIIDSLETQFDLSGLEVFTTTSIGITVFPNDGDDADTLIKNADSAMYHAKEKGKNNFQFFSESLNAAAHHRLSMEGKLRQALAREEFRLHYQPKYEIASGRLLGFEALLRWLHPEDGLIMPGQFISIAEDTGLILPIGEWVLEEACRQNRAWQQAGYPAVEMAVNISGSQLQRVDLPKMIDDVLRRTTLEPSFLETELTETILVSTGDKAIGLLNRIHELGVKIALDDFGTGYSSLSYLASFPIDNLKIDRSFIQSVDTDPTRATIVSAIIALAESLRLRVTAEGVETPAQLNFLIEKNCDYVQGFLFSKPLSSEKAEELLKADMTHSGVKIPRPRPEVESEPGKISAR